MPEAKLQKNLIAEGSVTAEGAILLGLQQWGFCTESIMHYALCIMNYELIISPGKIVYPTLQQSSESWLVFHVGK